MTPEHKAKLAAGRAKAKAAKVAAPEPVLNPLSVSPVLPTAMETIVPVPATEIAEAGGLRPSRDRPIHHKVPEKETRGLDIPKLDDAPVEGETVNFGGSVEGAEWPPVGEVEAIIEGFVPNPRLVGIRVMGRRASMWRGPRNWRGQEKILVKVDPAHAGAGNPIFLPI